MKFDIIAVEDLGDYSISDKDKSCELCGSNKDTFLAIVRYATRETPQEDEIMCLKCLGREGWKKIKGLSGYNIRINTISRIKGLSGYSIMKANKINTKEITRL